MNHLEDKDVVIVAGKRSPFVKAGKDFKDLHPADLGASVLREVLNELAISYDQIDEVIMGNTGNPVDSMNIARVIALRAKLPLKVSSLSVHRNCASGLESIAIAYDRIRSESADFVICGGVESMSQFPLLFQDSFKELFSSFLSQKTFLKKLKVLSKMRLKYLIPRIAIMEGLTDPFCGLLMGSTAEVLARQFNISRKEQDEFAVLSHQKTILAQTNKFFEKEICPIYIPKKSILNKDVGPRSDQSLEKLSKLKPYFERKHGSVTVGSSSPITDGACILAVSSRKKAKELNLPILAKIKSYNFTGLEPSKMGLGPVYASHKVLQKTRMSLKDMDVIELNEAFSAQVLSCLKAFSSPSFCQKELNLSDKMGDIEAQFINQKGGAISLGHPIGATGARLVLTTIHQLKEKNAQFGLASLCIGGGQGGAMILENERSS